MTIPSTGRARPDIRARPLLGLDDEALERLLWVPAGRLRTLSEAELAAEGLNRVLDGEPARRAREIGEVELLATGLLGGDALVDFWLRRPNPGLWGQSPLEWMGGPARRIRQLGMRLRQERLDRDWRPPA